MNVKERTKQTKYYYYYACLVFCSCIFVPFSVVFVCLCWLYNRHFVLLILHVIKYPTELT
jgi:hypothetical protein